MSLPSNVQILTATAKAFGLPVAQLTARGRMRRVVRARQAACVLLRWLMPANGVRRSYPAIARLFGQDDHSTAIHSAHKALAEAAINPQFAAALARAGELALRAARAEVSSEDEPPITWLKPAELTRRLEIERAVAASGGKRGARVLDDDGDAVMRAAGSIALLAAIRRMRAEQAERAAA